MSDVTTVIEEYTQVLVDEGQSIIQLCLSKGPWISIVRTVQDGEDPTIIDRLCS